MASILFRLWQRRMPVMASGSSIATAPPATTPAGRRAGQDGFKRRPPDLTVGPYLHLPLSDDPAQRRDRLAQIVKFGIHGTDMPGHEYLSDNDIASISLWLSQQIRQPSSKPITAFHPGDEP